MESRVADCLAASSVVASIGCSFPACSNGRRSSERGPERAFTELSVVRVCLADGRGCWPENPSPQGWMRTQVPISSVSPKPWGEDTGPVGTWETSRHSGNSNTIQWSPLCVTPSFLFAFFQTPAESRVPLPVGANSRVMIRGE